MSQQETRTILIVGDHGAVRVMLHQWLRVELPECRFVEASSGDQALALLASENPDLVLMDIGMRGINDIETAGRMKASHPHVKVVIVSSHDEPEYLTAAARAHVSGHVSKQFVWEQLIPLLRKFLYERRHRRLWSLTRSSAGQDWLPGEILPQPGVVDPDE